MSEEIKESKVKTLPICSKELPMCVNCEENEVSSKGMIICDDCIVHLSPEDQ